MQAVGNVVKEEISTLTVTSAEASVLTTTSTRTIVSAAPLRATAVESLTSGSKGEFNKALSDAFGSSLPHSPTPSSLAAEIDSSLASIRQNASNAVQTGLEDMMDHTKGAGPVTEEVKSLLSEFHA